MAAASGGLLTVTPSTIITDEQRRWVVIGICLNKLLNPVLKTVLGNEISTWYNTLCLPPSNINKQTYIKHEVKLAPSTMNLNYVNINNNNTIPKTKPSAYDYDVKDPESLAKLFVQPFMAKFTGFDQTMDLSAALTIMCEAGPFHTSGAAVPARKVRLDVRNKWAHCNFSHWSDPNYRASIQEMELLVKALKLSSADENDFLNELNNWRDKGVQLCCGQAVDSNLLELVKSEIDEINESLQSFQVKTKDAELNLKKTVQLVQQSFSQEIQNLRENQTNMGKDIKDLKVKQEALEKKVAKLAIGDEEVGYLFKIPERTEWFSGRESELNQLHRLFPINNEISEQKVQIVSVCGLGGMGKTSLATEYGHRWKDVYHGGVFWFSGEDEATFEKSVNDHAVSFGTLDTRLDRTLAKTLDVISKIPKPWLLVLDDMDEFKLCLNHRMLLSGPWKQSVRGSGHLLITTRREPKVMSETIRGFKESQCLQLECFSLEDGKRFVFRRTVLTSNENTSAEATKLVEILGGLPLALEQACAYISSVSCSVAMYLEQYKKDSVKLLNRQEASPVSIYESSERLAVRTTWLLNVNHIKQSPDGNFAVRFLHACAFFNPTEIQKELINPGKPPIEDAIYRDYVVTPLNSSHIFKLLSDFSLFRKNRSSSLTVHRLVQDVLRENLKSENQEILSLVDAVSMLCIAFSKHPSPDDLIADDVHDVNKRVSTQATDPSLFYFWKKMCLHAQEVLSVLYAYDVLDQRVLTPETARIVYECALHLNVSGKTDEAEHAFDFAHKILRLSGATKSKLHSLFSHEVPLPESVRRYIFYSCSTNFGDLDSSDSDKCKNTEFQPKSEKMRSQASMHFNQGSFHKAVEMYSYAMAETSLFAPKLLCERALAYIKLQQYKNALKDSEEYISLHPQCWMGLAIKALALHGLNEKWEACSIAALAFYYNRTIFRDYEPFKSTFSILESRIYICNHSSTLTDFLMKPVANSRAISDSPGKIIMIEPGDYLVNVEHYPYNSPFFNWIGLTDKGLSSGLIIDDCILLGVENTKSSVVIRLHEEPFSVLGITSGRRVMAANISFVFSKGNWESHTNSVTTLLNCSFTSSLKESNYTFFSLGADTFKECSFQNCKSPGLTVMGKTNVERCVFSGGDYSGVHVNKGGRLEIKESKVHGNEHGIYITEKAEACSVTNCDIFDNKWHGIYVTKNTTNVNVGNCRIYHNDRNGIFIADDSSAFVSNCEIFENGWQGIATICNGRCTVSHSKIYRNKYGGVQVVPVDNRKSTSPSIVQFNDIHENGGPGIYVEMMFEDTPLHSSVIRTESAFQKLFCYRQNEGHFLQARCSGNMCSSNEDTTSKASSKNIEMDSEFCFNCLKKCSSRCSRCFITTYCDQNCQKQHWKKHKKECLSILEKSTVTINVIPRVGLINFEHAESIQYSTPQHPGLAPKGPKYAGPPKAGERFLVKILAADEEWHSNLEGPLLTICDRSLTVNGVLDKKSYPKLHNIVRECGVSSTIIEGWKKKFFWAQFHDKDHRTLDVFTTKFPQNEDW